MIDVSLFYRIFYRTGRNRSVSSNTVQHGESRKTRSDGTRRTQQHQPTPVQREFKSPLAHQVFAGQGPCGTRENGRLLPERARDQQLSMEPPTAPNDRSGKFASGERRDYLTGAGHDRREIERGASAYSPTKGEDCDPAAVRQTRSVKTTNSAGGNRCSPNGGTRSGAGCRRVESRRWCSSG